MSAGRDGRPEGGRILAWARRWLAPEDVARVVEPAVADWRHEVAQAPDGERGRVARRGRWALLRAIAAVMAHERLALARATPWWLLAFPALCVGVGTFAFGVGTAASQAAFMGVGALVFGLVATTPGRWIGPTWAWAGVALLAVTLVAGLSDAGATRWLAVGPLRVQVTMLALPLVVVGGWRPAAVAAALLAASPDALAGGVVAVAVPHPLTWLAAVVALVREPAMTSEVAWSVAGVLTLVPVAAVAWRWRALAEGRAVLAIVAGGALAHGLGHAPLPLVGYGGSALVAVCLAFALAVARRGGWTEEAPLG